MDRREREELLKKFSKYDYLKSKGHNPDYRFPFEEYDNIDCLRIVVDHNSGKVIDYFVDEKLLANVWERMMEEGIGIPEDSCFSLHLDMVRVTFEREIYGIVEKYLSREARQDKNKFLKKYIGTRLNEDYRQKTIEEVYKNIYKELRQKLKTIKLILCDVNEEQIKKDPGFNEIQSRYNYFRRKTSELINVLKTINKGNEEQGKILKEIKDKIISCQIKNQKRYQDHYRTQYAEYRNVEDYLLPREYSFLDKDYKNIIDYIIRTSLYKTIKKQTYSLKDLYDSFPIDYIYEKLYDPLKLDIYPQDSYEQLESYLLKNRFVQQFTKSCSQICKKEDGSLYTNIEINTFLIKQILKMAKEEEEQFEVSFEPNEEDMLYLDKLVDPIRPRRGR